jgi:hypothetical protein
MALSRRAFLPLLAVGLAGCSGLNNRAPELAIENRSGSEQDVVAYVIPVDGTEATDGASGSREPDYEGTIPPGSRVLKEDVVAAPPEGESVEVAADIETGSYAATERVTVTGPGTVDVRITRNGISVFFEGKE